MAFVTILNLSTRSASSTAPSISTEPQTKPPLFLHLPLHLPRLCHIMAITNILVLSAWSVAFPKPSTLTEGKNPTVMLVVLILRPILRPVPAVINIMVLTVPPVFSATSSMPTASNQRCLLVSTILLCHLHHHLLSNPIMSHFIPLAVSLQQNYSTTLSSSITNR